MEPMKRLGCLLAGLAILIIVPVLGAAFVTMFMLIGSALFELDVDLIRIACTVYVAFTIYMVVGGILEK